MQVRWTRVLCVTALGALLLLPRPQFKGLRADKLEPGKSVRLELEAGSLEGALYRVRVPVEATALRIVTAQASRDVECYLRYDEPPLLEEGLFDVSGPNTWLDEELLLEDSDPGGLEPGTWFVRVVAPGAPATPNGSAVSCSLLAELVLPIPKPAAFGETLAVELVRQRGLRAVLTPLPPAGGFPSRVRIEAVCASADVDLLVGPAAPARTRAEALAWSESPFQYESLELPGEAFAQGLVVHAFARPAFEVSATLPLYLRISDASTAAQLVPPMACASQVGAGPFARAASAVAAVFSPLGSGSGVLVAERGYVLSNAHVVVGAQGGQAGDLALGFTLDLRLAAVPSFRLEIVDYREDLDLALLRIVGGLDGRPLEPGQRFPFLPLVPQAEPELGSVLYCMGYPMTGGSGSLVPITLSRGIFSGYGAEQEGLLYKTDAATHAGISGGACLDAQGTLLAIPCSSISDDNQAGGLGFALPTRLVPQAWLELLRQE